MAKRIAKKDVRAAKVKMPGKVRVLEYLKEKGWITPLVAWHVLGVYRLADVIYKLRKEGYRIETHMDEDELGRKYGLYILYD